MDESRLEAFVAFAQGLKGDEKSEAQSFLTHLFQAYGQAGVIEAGATFEHRIRIENSTKFSDLLWPGRVLIEMKSRGVRLDRAGPAIRAAVGRCGRCGLEKAAWSGKGDRLCETCSRRESRRAVCY